MSSVKYKNINYNNMRNGGNDANDFLIGRRSVFTAVEVKFAVLRGGDLSDTIT